MGVKWVLRTRTRWRRRWRWGNLGSHPSRVTVEAAGAVPLKKPLAFRCARLSLPRCADRPVFLLRHTVRWVGGDGCLAGPGGEGGGGRCELAVLNPPDQSLRTARCFE